MSDTAVILTTIVAVFFIVAWALSRVAVWECRRDIARAQADTEQASLERDRLVMGPLRGPGGRFTSRENQNDK